MPETPRKGLNMGIPLKNWYNPEGRNMVGPSNHHF
jgi:hypothetical protein